MDQLETQKVLSLYVWAVNLSAFYEATYALNGMNIRVCADEKVLKAQVDCYFCIRSRAGNCSLEAKLWTIVKVSSYERTLC